MKTVAESLRAFLSARSPGAAVAVVVPSRDFGRALVRDLMLVESKPELLFRVRLLTEGDLLTELSSIRHAVLGIPVPEEPHDRLAVSGALAAQFRSKKPLKMAYFDWKQIQSAAGYAEAFARVLVELDRDSLSPAQASGTLGHARLKDLATLDAAIRPALVGRPLSVGPLQSTLSTLLESSSADAKNFQNALRRHLGSVFRIQSGHERPTTTRFLEALVAALPGSASFKIEPQGALSDAVKGRPAAEVIEIWQNTDEQSRATLHWIHDELEGLEKTGVKSGVFPQLAVIGPQSEIDRLMRTLGHELGPDTCYLPQGAAFSERASFARLNAVLNAMESHLDYRVLLDVCRNLKLDEKFENREYFGPDQKRRYPPTSRRSWIDALTDCGILGGTSLDPSGLSKWKTFSNGRPWFEGYQPALDELVEITQAYATGAAPDQWVSRLASWMDRELKLLPDDRAASAEAFAIWKRWSSEHWLRDMPGTEILSLLRQALGAIRLPHGSPEKATVFMGTLSQAAGISFHAIRFVGANEGRFPEQQREDPILPDDLRVEWRKLNPNAPKTSVVRTHEQWEKFLFLASSPRGRRTFSCALEESDASESAPASYFVDLAGSLPRTQDGLKADCERAFDARASSGSEPWQSQPLNARDSIEALRERSAGNPKQAIPKSWTKKSAIQYSATVAAKEAIYSGAAPTPHDGYFPAGAEQTLLPGLPQKPLRGSKAGDLLKCPHQFFLQQVLNWGEVSELPERGELSPAVFGTLVHSALERIAKKKDAAEMLQLTPAQLQKLAESVLDEVAKDSGEWVFLGDGEAQRQQLKRMKRLVLRQLQMDQGRKPTQIEPEVELAGTVSVGRLGELHFTGHLDRLEMYGKKAVLADFKTGRAKKQDELDPGFRIQLLVYLRLLVDMKRFKPSDFQAIEYRFLGSPESRDDVFEGKDLQALQQEADSWFELLAKVLQERVFPRTTKEENCKYCQFQKLCGVDRLNRTSSLQQKKPHPIVAKLLKQWGVEE